MKSGGERITTKAAASHSNTVAAAALGSTFNSLFREATAGAVDLSRVYGSWVACIGPGSIPNNELPGSPDDEDSHVDSGVCQAGQSKQESRTKSMVHASWSDSPDCQTPALKPLPEFCVVNPGSEEGVKVDLGSERVHNEQISTASANATEKN